MLYKKLLRVIDRATQRSLERTARDLGDPQRERAATVNPGDPLDQSSSAATTGRIAERISREMDPLPDPRAAGASGGGVTDSDQDKTDDTPHPLRAQGEERRRGHPTPPTLVSELPSDEEGRTASLSPVKWGETARSESATGIVLRSARMSDDLEARPFVVTEEHVHQDFGGRPHVMPVLDHTHKRIAEKDGSRLTTDAGHSHPDVDWERWPPMTGPAIPAEPAGGSEAV